MRYIFTILISICGQANAQTYDHYSKTDVYLGSTKVDGDRTVSRDSRGVLIGSSKKNGHEIDNFDARGVYQGSTKIH